MGKAGIEPHFDQSLCSLMSIFGFHPDAILDLTANVVPFLSSSLLFGHIAT